MCRPVQCRACGRRSWAGCGDHVEQVMAGVPAAERCTCREDAAAAVGATQRGGVGQLLRRFRAR